MIKVGDKLLIKGKVYIIQNESYNDNKVEAKCMSELKFVEMEFDTALGYAFAYEKQRADELEKRWSELVDVLKKKYEYYKVRADDESAGPIEQGKWKIAKLELMMVLMTMAELQEDDND